MRFYHILTLALAVICLFGQSGLGAPADKAKGRYTWLECKPDGMNSNCVKKMGPLIPLNGKSSRLPPSAAKDIVAVSEEEATPDMEELSGDASGDSATFPAFVNKEERWMRDTAEQDMINTEEEGSTFGIEYSGDTDYSNYVSPEKFNWLSKEDFKEDNIIA